MRNRLSFILIAMMGVTDAAAQPCPSYPESFAQNFYRTSYAFFNESPDQVSSVITPELLRKLQDERDCVARKGRCRLQYDPWLGAQDGGIGYPVQFRRESQDAKSAVVAMSYPAGASGSAPTRSVKLKLRKDVDTACWLLDDFIMPTGESVSAVLGRPKPAGQEPAEAASPR